MTHFFAYMSRMRLIRRWSLMRNTAWENVSEHSHQVAIIAHALALFGNARHGKGWDPAKAALLAVYHEAGEVVTGDLPTPIKYYNDEIRRAYKAIEGQAAARLHAMLPDDIRAHYETLLLTPESEPEYRIVKAADRISAYLKCLEEARAGNDEFKEAGQSILSDIRALNLPEADDFMRECAPSFALSLDELSRGDGG